MSEKIIVAADLGSFKAYRLLRTTMNTPRLEVLEEMRLVDGHGKLGDKLTDQAGRYSVPMQDMAMSYGERQKIGLELRRRLIKQIGERLNDLAKNPEVDGIYFAAASEINDLIMNETAPQTREKIERNVTSNLTNVQRPELLKHFLEPEPAR
jgi:hypothetical protein